LKYTKSQGFTDLRVTVNWAELATDSSSKQKPSGDYSNPDSYEQVRWERLDELVTSADGLGFNLMLDIGFWAPYWATDDPSGSQGQRARDNINPAMYAEFAQAVARRYRGDWTPPGAQNPLPEIDSAVLWNEPNIPGFLTPQFKKTRDGKEPASPHIYRKMVEAALPGLRAINPNLRVLIGATSSSGSYDVDGLRGGVPPIDFLKAFACVDGSYKPLKNAQCADYKPVRADGWSHHPYTFEQVPNLRSRQTSDVRMGDLPRLEMVLNKLVDRDRLGSKNAEIWITEFGYWADGKKTKRSASETKQDRWTVWSHSLASSRPQVRSFAQFLIRDVQCDYTGIDSCLPWPTGWFSSDGKAKGIVGNINHSLVATKRGGKVQLWSRLSGEWALRDVRVEERRGGKWVEIARVRGESGGIWSRYVPRGGDKFRLTSEGRELIKAPLRDGFIAQKVSK
jgi:hypothetical protein